MRILSAVLLLFALLLSAISPAFAAEPVTPSGLSFAEMERQIEALLSEHVGTTTPGVAIVVVHEGEIIFSRGYGFADIENQIPVDPASTIFEHGSINKTFVWISVMQLVEQGLLDLDVDIATYLPGEFARQLNFERTFTMRDLLNHMAGFEDSFLDAFFDKRTVQNHLTLEEVLLLTQPRQIYAVGTVSAYSNWGSTLAAYVVEQISGLPFHVYVREHVLLPANMHNTRSQPDWFGDYAFLQNRVVGYTRSGNGFNRFMPLYVSIYPAGSTNGTVIDLAYFIKALTPATGERSPLFENHDTLREIFTPSSLNPVRFPGTYHGFMRLTGVVLTFGHGGGLPTSSTLFAIEPESRFGFAVFTNVGDEIDIVTGLHDLLMGNAMAYVPPSPDNLPSAESVEGRFIFSNQFGGFLEMANYFNIVQITAIDSNAIELSMMGGITATYRQVLPYVFQRISLEGRQMHLNLLWSELRFDVEDGVLRHVNIGGGFDLVPLPPGRSMPFLLASLIGAVLSGAFFLIAPTALSVLFIIRRKKQRTRTLFDTFSTGFLLSGTLLVLNFLVFFARIAINVFRTSTEVAPHIWMNYVLAGLMVLLFAASLWSWRTTGEARIKRKVLFVVTTISAALFIFLLLNWQFFVIL